MVLLRFLSMHSQSHVPILCDLKSDAGIKFYLCSAQKQHIDNNTQQQNPHARAPVGVILLKFEVEIKDPLQGWIAALVVFGLQLLLVNSLQSLQHALLKAKPKEHPNNPKQSGIHTAFCKPKPLLRVSTNPRAIAEEVFHEPPRSSTTPAGLAWTPKTSTKLCGRQSTYFYLVHTPFVLPWFVWTSCHPMPSSS